VKISKAVDKGPKSWAHFPVDENRFHHSRCRFLAEDREKRPPSTLERFKNTVAGTRRSRRFDMALQIHAEAG